MRALCLALGVALAVQQPPTFRTGTNLVQVDAIVTDQHGDPVADLTADDFELTDDGKPMTIQSVRYLGADQVEPPGPYGPIRTVDDEEREASKDGVRVFAILLDDYHVPPQYERRVVQPLLEFVRQLPASDLVGVYNLFDSIRDAHLTRNREPALKAISQFYGRRGDYMPKFPVEERHLMRPREIEMIRAQITEGALSALATHLGGFNERRKTLIFVSGGFQIARHSITEIASAANRQNVAIYPVDPSGMPAPAGDLAPPDYSAEGVPHQFGGPMRRIPAGLKDLLFQFAYETGGTAIVNRNDFRESLARIARESRSYYLIGYESPHPTDGRFHKVRVKVKRPRLNVKARSGYQAFKP